MEKISYGNKSAMLFRTAEDKQRQKVGNVVWICNNVTMRSSTDEDKRAHRVIHWEPRAPAHNQPPPQNHHKATICDRLETMSDQLKIYMK